VLKPVESPHVQALGDGLVMRTAASQHDVERVAEFNGAIHGAEIASMTRHLFLDHPNTSGRDLIFVEDERSGQVVSSICVIPWTWRYEDVLLPAGEMGIVGTLEAYRHRGLIRTQVGFFKQRLQERGCLLSHIQGIAYYYRQFGYEYALPLDIALVLSPNEGPKTETAPFTFRKATLDDLPLLTRLCDEAIWRYLFTCTDNSGMEHEKIIIEESGRSVGYVMLPTYHFGDDLMINEASSLSAGAAEAVLVYARELAVQRGKPGIRLNVPFNSPLMQVARPYTNREWHAYAWQIHVPDMVALLRALAPVLERRLAASPFAGLTQEAQIGLYKRTIALRFVAGRLAEVADLGFRGHGPIAIPPLQFIPLVLGYRSIQELKLAYPDVHVAPSHRFLVDTLFPKVPSYISTIY
jgi:predicted N-acetyltransferase YhbS